MIGNELSVGNFLLNNIGQLSLPHLGIIEEMASPVKQSSELQQISTEQDLAAISAHDPIKKADIYLNNQGISIKQTGGSFSFNRIQRANIITLYQQLQFTDIPQKLKGIDSYVFQFHRGLLSNRSIPWCDFLSEPDFKQLLEFLMMKGSPNKGFSEYPARYILEAPKKNIDRTNINLYSFDEYFELYKEKIFVAIRRQWIGQSSDSEHKRALGLSKKTDNLPWIFDEVVGTPKIQKKTGTSWRDAFPVDQRKTVYFLMIEKKK